MSIEIRKIIESDIPAIMDSISILEWNREDTVYFQYLQEQEQGLREVFVAFYEGDFAGHVNLICQKALILY